MPAALLSVLEPTMSSDFSKTALHTDNHIKLMRMVLPAGKQIPSHQAPGVLTVYCVAGKVDFTVGPETHPLSTGTLIYVPDRQSHSLTATEDSILLITIFLDLRI